jgi:pyridoxamine 5'-phosphate oxidase
MSNITFLNNINIEPYKNLRRQYKKAVSKNQKPVNAISISSYNSISSEVNSRYVNLKIIDKDKFIFFTNYNSPKSEEFQLHNQISAIIFWDSINFQLRMKAKIKKLPLLFNKEYFKGRSHKKNALAISSQQSKTTQSFNEVKKNYKKSLDFDNLTECPDYWGGYSFTPYSFEFWTGDESRINKRELYVNNHGHWDHSFLQP